MQFIFSFFFLLSNVDIITFLFFKCLILLLKIWIFATKPSGILFYRISPRRDIKLICIHVCKFCCWQRQIIKTKGSKSNENITNFFDIDSAVLQDKLLEGEHYDLRSDFEQGLESFDDFCLKNKNLFNFIVFYTSLIWSSKFEIKRYTVQNLFLILRYMFLTFNVLLMSS